MTTRFLSDRLDKNVVKEMKVGLVRLRDVHRVESPPLSLAYVGASLKEAGFTVAGADLGVTLRHIRDWDVWVEEAVSILQGMKADVLGFTLMTSTYPLFAQVIRVYSQENPDTTIMVGGPHATFVPRDVMEDLPQIDIVVQGEGEATAVDVMEAVEKGYHPHEMEEVRGIWYRDNGRIIQNEERPLIKDLDTIPFPDFSLFPHLREYHPDGLFLNVPMYSSRGCAYRCAFCALSTLWKYQRRRSPEKIVEELKVRLEQYGNKVYFWFFDDEPTLNKKWMMKICHLIKEEGLDIHWLTESRTDTIDSELMGKVSEAGCLSMFYGIETGSPAVQRAINKNLDVNQARKVVEKTVEHGILPKTAFILGFPTETKEDMLKTIQFAMECRRMGAFIMIGRLYVFPGTPLWEKREELVPVPIKGRDFFSSLLFIEPERPFLEDYKDIIWAAPDLYCFKQPGMDLEESLDIIQAGIKVGLSVDLDFSL